MNIKLYILFCFFGFAFLEFSQAQNLDINMLKQIHVNRNKQLDPTFRFITDSDIPISLGTPAILVATGWFSRDSLLFRNGIIAAEAFAVNVFVTTALKYSINRDRPYETYAFISPETNENTPSFPSGHTSTAFATATSLSLTFKKWYVALPAYSWATAVGYSRMHLGVHYPSDVLVGALIGAGTAALTYKLNEKYKIVYFRKLQKNRMHQN